MNTRFRCFAALVGIFVLVPQYANAAEYLVTYAGKITAGVDVDNVFGLFGQDLSERDLRADITYSTSVPLTRTAKTAKYDEIAGGESFGTAPVISTAKFTIGSKIFMLYPSFYGDVYTSSNFMNAYGYDDLGNSFQTFIVPDKSGPVSLQSSFFSSGVGDGGGSSTQYSYLIAGNDDIDFNALSVTVSAVPEPATWAMMFIGLSAVGLILRRRQKVPPPPISQTA